MSSQPEPHAVCSPAAGERDALLTELGECYDAHGPDLYRLARLICPTTQVAALAVAQAFDAAFHEAPLLGRRVRTRHFLARLTYLACAELHPVAGALPLRERDLTLGAVVRTRTSELEPQCRALLALTMYGDHTYAEAAALLHIDPATAAEALRRALLETATGTRYDESGARRRP